MGRTYITLWRLLDTRERRQALGLLLLTLVLAVIEAAGVASILPFLAVLSDPGLVDRTPVLAAVREATGLHAVRDFLILLASVTIGLVVGGQATKALTIYLLTWFSRRRELTLSVRLLSGYLRQPYSWFLERHSAELGARILEEVQNVISGAMIPALRLIVQGAVAIGLLSLMLVVDPMVTCLSVAIIGTAYVGIALLSRRYLTEVGQASFRATADAHRATQEAFGGFKDVKLLGVGPAYVERYRAAAERTVRANASFVLAAELPRYVLETIVSGGMVLLLLLLMLSSDKAFSDVLPTVGLFAFAGAKLFPAIQQIYSSVSSLRYTSASLDALVKDIDEMPAEEPVDDGQMVLEDRIELRDVVFRYPSGSRSSLDGLSVTIPARSTIGLIGPSGAGKTTAVDVLLGLLAPQGGVLSVDGVPVGPNNLRTWQRLLGYVPQEIFLTDDSLAANIALGVPADRIDMAAVEQAARAAELHDFVRSDLPDGYATPLGERGVRLSGGQRQRVGIARALYRDPQVLVLDEATSSLDTETERAVMDAVRNLAHQKTIVIIAHRLTTVAFCDTIFVLEDGRVVRQGPADEILAGQIGASKQDN